MANASLFRSLAGALLPKTDTVNAAGGRAYALDPRHALAQYASTGCMNGTFYADAEAQLATVLELALVAPTEFVARVAIHARHVGYMKDMPALLCAVLAARDVRMLGEIFARVCDSAKMVRTFVQILRSGVVGRKSLGSAPKRLVRAWMQSLSDEQLFAASVGNDPSLADLIKMIHPKPTTPARKALYAWLIGKPYEAGDLPGIVREFEAYKADRSLPIPDVPFQMLTSLELGARAWTSIARTASWQTTRMNLNTFARHGVFDEPGMAGIIAARLRDRDLIAKARVFPYQLMVAFTMCGPDIPAEVREALQDAMEAATENVPSYAGRVFVCPDVSGSMRSPITGHRRGSTTSVSCLQVAALMAAAVVRRNHGAEVMPFSDHVVEARLNPRDSVMTNAQTLAALPSGGTNCSAPLAELNRRKASGVLVILVSDNESWIDARPGGRGTELLAQWELFRRRNPQAKLVCVDLAPNATVQAPDRADILNVGGFGDQVFSTIATFAEGGSGPGHWVGEIDRIAL